MFLPATPFTVSNRPPMYTVFLSGDAVTARTTALDPPLATLSTQLVGAPVAASSTTSRDRLMLDELPSAAPGGRTWVKSPPANTLPCAAASPQTVPLVCHVGNASRNLSTCMRQRFVRFTGSSWLDPPPRGVRVG